MFVFRHPTDEFVQSLLASQAGEPYSYDGAGLTRETPKPRVGWNVDHHRVLLGHGRGTFEAAQEAIRRWEMFPRQMARVCWPQTRQEPGNVVAVVYRAQPLFCWMIFPCRIVYVVDDLIPRQDGRVHRFGFAYGTLRGHPERGEERFLVEWHESDDSVWYDLLPVSQPAHPIARVGYPYTRYEQARFRRLSGRAMQAAVAKN